MVTSRETTVRDASVPRPATPVRSWPENGPKPAVAGVAGAAAAAAPGVGSTLGAGAVPAVGSLARTTPAGSSATTVQPRSVESTRPVTFTASPGSMSGSSAAAWPCRITGPVAVPSSRRNPSGSRSPTMPPTRTVTPSKPARFARSASGTAGVAPVGAGKVRRAAGRARSPGSAGAPRTRDRAGAGRVVRGRDPVHAKVAATPRKDREAPVLRGRVRPTDDADDGGEMALEHPRHGDPGTGLAEHDHPVLPDEQLRPPPIAELVHRVDPASNGHEPPLLGEARRAVQEHRRRDRRRALPFDPGRGEPRRAVRGPHGPVDAHARPDRRCGAIRWGANLDRAGAVLDDEEPAAAVEQGRRRGHDGDDGDRSTVRALGRGDREGSDGGRAPRCRRGRLRRRGRRGDRRGGRCRGEQHDICGVARAQAIAVEGTGPRRTLADDAGDPVRAADREHRGGDRARTRPRGP